jgi:hypothetical protein
MDLSGTGLEAVDLMCLDQTGAVEHDNKPSASKKSG